MYIKRGDPGPCPVCGSPHTSCTPESVTEAQRAPEAASQVEEPPVTFTTATYERAKHGALIGKKRSRRRTGG